jgi:8-oxo-dGTP pyrophosphatase MutT (NUDIX family)
MRKDSVSPEDIEQALEEHPRHFYPALPGRSNHLEAAVMIPLRWRADLETVMMLRPVEMRHHGGEVCFPGGQVEASDGSHLAAALRETREELGITPVKILGTLSSIPLYTSDYRITPVVCEINDDVMSPCASEVARVLTLNITQLFARPCIDAFEYDIGAGVKLSPVFEVEGETMFGATAYALLELLHILSRLAAVPVPPLRATGYKWDTKRRRPVVAHG